jgi:hypothetical protein
MIDLDRSVEEPYENKAKPSSLFLAHETNQILQKHDRLLFLKLIPTETIREGADRPYTSSTPLNAVLSQHCTSSSVARKH